MHKHYLDKTNGIHIKVNIGFPVSSSRSEFSCKSTVDSKLAKIPKLQFSYVDSIHVFHLLWKSYHILVYYRFIDYKVLAEEHKHDKCTFKVQSKKNSNNL